MATSNPNLVLICSKSIKKKLIARPSKIQDVIKYFYYEFFDFILYCKGLIPIII